MKYDPHISRYDGPTSIGAMPRHASAPALVGGSYSAGVIVDPDLLTTTNIAGFFEDVGQWFEDAFRDIGKAFEDAWNWFLDAWDKLKDAWDVFAEWVIEGPLGHVVAGICLVTGVGAPVAALIEGALWSVHGAMTAIDAGVQAAQEVRDAAAVVIGNVEAVAGELSARLEDFDGGAVTGDAGFFASVDLAFLPLAYQPWQIDTWQRLAELSPADRTAELFAVASETWLRMAESDDPIAAYNGKQRLIQTALQTRLVQDAPELIAADLATLRADTRVPSYIPIVAALLSWIGTPTTPQAELEAARLLVSGLGSEPQGFFDALVIGLRDSRGAEAAAMFVASKSSTLHASPALAAQRLTAIGAWLAGEADLPVEMVAHLRSMGFGASIESAGAELRSAPVDVTAPASSGVRQGTASRVEFGPPSRSFLEEWKPTFRGLSRTQQGEYLAGLSSKWGADVMRDAARVLYSDLPSVLSGVLEQGPRFLTTAQGPSAKPVFGFSSSAQAIEAARALLPWYETASPSRKADYLIAYRRPSFVAYYKDALKILEPVDYAALLRITDAAQLRRWMVSREQRQAAQVAQALLERTETTIAPELVSSAAEGAERAFRAIPIASWNGGREVPSALRDTIRTAVIRWTELPIEARQELALRNPDVDFRRGLERWEAVKGATETKAAAAQPRRGREAIVLPSGAVLLGRWSEGAGPYSLRGSLVTAGSVRQGRFEEARS